MSDAPIVPLADHRVCGWRWHTDSGWHECHDAPTHAMEHRCNCGELYPS